MIRVVLADDHALMREGLKYILRKAEDIEIQAEATDGFEVLSLVRKGGFDVLVMDLSMPGRSGMDLIKQIKEEAPQIAVLVLTMHDEDQYAARAIRLGAHGYITKESAGADLVTAIRKVHAGRPYISMEVAEQLAMDAMPNRHETPHKSLTNREFEVFNMLVTGKSVTDIADALHLSVKTVSTHKAHILQKLGTPSLAELVQYAMAQGLLEKFRP